MTHQVQRGPFGGQQSSRGRLDGQHRLAGLQPVAIFDAVLDDIPASAQHLVEYQQSNVHTGDDARLAGDHRRRRRRICAHCRQCGDIGPVPQVFLEAAGDHPPGLCQLVGIQYHQAQTTAGTRLRAIAGSVFG